MPVLGMDPERVNALANQMTASAAAINTTISQLTHLLGGALWQGPDRDQFMSDWNGTHVSQLRAVASALDGESTYLKVQVKKQIQASG
jgi:hypothetical protein